ncbi:enoyl-CoA hydratase/isomerase family protein [Cryptosporangium aurantiacum]|uniref:3-hydroxypropionyl-coenzyme A dehydratase n=1 Tax=Cryptosporangium aurantiacum TaxID=134849 RepID=A0A1M7R4S8_9ACTN|nr:enoyl-CoA hydratase/isomerase family protein [Cryptosporangium aurantiacum]SHN39883.1 3-hydroxypropionyl-coenzyme A dehydratase [Cryptosporangium aurantiacum]
MSTVELTVEGGVGVISLNRPHRHNAVDDELHKELLRIWAAVQADPDVRVVVLRGNGPSFCSGRDTAQLGERVAGESDLSFIRRHQRTRIDQLDSPKPVIAAVRGAVLGGGLEMALAADIRIAASDVAMGFPEIRYGLMTDTGGSGLATALAGPSRAKLMLMTGRRIDAGQALAWGLVDQVVAPAELDDVSFSLAIEIAGHSTAALTMLKATVDGVWHGQLHTALRAELLAQVALFGSEDYRARKPGPGRNE